MSNYVSVRKVFGISWQRMKDILFHPFSLGKWFVLGFCAWVISLGGQSGGTGTNFNQSFRHTSRHGGGDAISSFWTHLDQTLNGSNGTFTSRAAETFNISPSVIGIIIVVVIAGILLVLALTLLFTWLRFRFEFIFLDNLVFNQTNIVAPWKQFKPYANSVWGYYWLIVVAVTIINLFLSIPLLLGGWQWLKRCAAAHDLIMPTGGEISSLIFLGLIILLLNLAFWIWHFFMVNFQIPLMYRKQMLFKESAVALWQIVKDNLGTFFRFWLLCILIDIVFILVLTIGGVLTCCILFLLLIIPVINTTILLPYLAFKRYFGVDLLAALAPELSPYPVPEVVPEITPEEGTNEQAGNA